MPELINNLTRQWKQDLEENKNLEKLWDFFELYNDDPGEIVIQIKDEWEAFVNVFQIVVSLSKLEFEDNRKAFSPFLSVRKSSHVLEFKRYDKLDNMKSIMGKISEFVDDLPDIKVEVEEEVEEEE